LDLIGSTTAAAIVLLLVTGFGFIIIGIDGIFAAIRHRVTYAKWYWVALLAMMIFGVVMELCLFLIEYFFYRKFPSEQSSSLVNFVISVFFIMTCCSIFTMVGYCYFVELRDNRAVVEC